MQGRAPSTALGQGSKGFAFKRATSLEIRFSEFPKGLLDVVPLRLTVPPSCRLRGPTAGLEVWLGVDIFVLINSSTWVCNTVICH